MITRFNIGKLKVKIIFRYQGDSKEVFDRFRWNEKKLGIWWKKYSAVGTKLKGRKMFNKENNAPGIMFGFHLLWANLWFDFGWGVKTFEINDND